MEGFECPKCGSYMFGTSKCTGPRDEMIGHCHGYEAWHCDFTWERKDDAKYGFFEGKPPVLNTDLRTQLKTAQDRVGELEKMLAMKQDDWIDACNESERYEKALRKITKNNCRPVNREIAEQALSIDKWRE